MGQNLVGGARFGGLEDLERLVAGRFDRQGQSDGAAFPGDKHGLSAAEGVDGLNHPVGWGDPFGISRNRRGLSRFLYTGGGHAS